MRRQPLQDQMNPAAQRSRQEVVPAPVAGWNTRDSIANMKPTYALLMDNWVPEPSQVVMRKGQAQWATGMTGPVRSLLSYRRADSASVLFAGTDSGIFDVTAGGTVGAASSSCTNGDWRYVNCATTGGQFIACCNGVDPYRYFGNGWTSPTLTFATAAYDSSKLNNVAFYNQRLYFVENNSLAFKYLPAGSIAGDLLEFPLGQLATKGGHLVAIGSWSVDGGAGPDDRIAFATSEGEVIIYSGTDPSTDGSFTLIGRYYIGRPLGPRCFLKYGGDLLFLTERGVYPLSRAILSATIDRTVAISSTIDSAFTDIIQRIGIGGAWSLELCPSENLLIVNVPSTPPVQHVMQLQTKGWCRFLGLSAYCFANFNGKLFYGENGRVVQAQTGMSDFGANIVATVQPAYQRFGTNQMMLSLIKMSLAGSGQFSYDLNASTDFDFFGHTSTNTFPTSNQGIWDESTFDDAVWASGFYLQDEWTSIEANPFYYISVGLRVASKSVQASFIATNFMLQSGSGI